MIAQIYKETYYNYSTKDEIENTVFPEPILIEFRNSAAFEQWRIMKQTEYAEKYNKERGLEGDKKHVIHLHFALRGLV